MFDRAQVFGFRASARLLARAHDGHNLVIATKGGRRPDGKTSRATPARTASARASKTDCKNYGLKPSASVRRLAVA